MSRIIRVIFSQEAEAEYQKLLENIKEEKQKEVNNSENQKLLRSIEEKIERIKIAADSGIPIPKKLFPQKYLLKHSVNNLWKMNLFNYWRLIYTIKGDRIEVLCIVLDLIGHPAYDKIFSYRKK